MKKLFLIALFALLQMLVGTAFAQLTSGDITDASGYHLRVTESAATVESDADLEYTIDFVFPVPNVNMNSHFYIDFQYNGDLQRISVTHPPTYTAVGGGGTFTPLLGLATPGQITMTINSTLGTVPGTVFGQFKVLTRMPPRFACQGQVLEASASLHYFRTPGPSGILTTNTPNTIVRSTVQITNPWVVIKGCTNAILRGGTCSNYLIEGDVLNYRVDVELADPSRTRGSQDLNNVVLTDVPSQTGGVFALIPNANLPPGSVLNTTGINITAAGQIILPGGVNFLDAVGQPAYHINFSYTVPPGTPLGCVTNRATLTGNDPCNNPVVLQSRLSNVERVADIPAGLIISKTVEVQGNLPGCTGTYFIRIRNAAGNQQMNYDLVDVMPGCLQIPPLAGTAPVGGVITQIAPFQFRMQGQLPAAGTTPVDHIYTINFTIGQTCVGQIDNTVWTVDQANLPAIVLVPPTATAPIVVLPQAVVPCLSKSICQPAQSYNPGAIIRFKLRVQNFGALPMQGWAITDDLASAGLIYRGNESYYWTNTRPRVDNLCGAPLGANDWTPMVTNNGVNAGVLCYTISTPTPVCDANSRFETQLNIGCNNGGTNLPAFYIEFDAEVAPDAAVGVARNCAVLTGNGGNTTACIPFTINGLTTYSIDKAVSLNGGETFVQSANVVPGQTIQYRLHAQSTGARVQMPYFIDLLPRNRGYLIPPPLPIIPPPMTQDRFLTQPIDRGSTADVTYLSPSPLTAPAINAFRWDNMLDLNLKVDFPSANFGTNVTTFPSLGAFGNKNFKVEYAELIAGPTNDLTYVFNAKIPIGASTNTHACNTFGFDCFKNVFSNYVAILERQLPMESSPVCVEVIDPPCCQNDSIVIPTTACVNTPVLMCSRDHCNDSINYHWDFGDGTPIANVDLCANHTYTAAGTYQVVVTWDICGISNSFTQSITITDCAPCCCRVDSFVMPQQVCKGFAAAFCAVDHCDHDISYMWNFGDGTPSVTTANRCVNHTYAQSGGYTVEVLWTDCEGDHRQVFGIEVNECNPCDITPDFTFDAATHCPTVDFTASPNQNNLTYVWDFGDGTFGSGQATSHTYAPGSYRVTLFIYTIDPNNGDLCRCMVKIDHTIDVPDCLNKGFNNSKVSSSLSQRRGGGAEVTSSDRGIGLALTPQLGNKVLSTLRHHQPGDGCCCWVDTFNVPSQVCTGFAAQFCAMDHCDHDISYTWNFGDGTPSVTTTNRCLSHTYMLIGSYNVEVMWTDCDGDHRQVFDVDAINCDPCGIKPDFTFDINSFCPTVDFYATPVQNNLLYVWDFGDGTFGNGQTTSHTYAPGSYAVTLIIYSINPANGDLCRCKVKIVQTVDVPDCFNKAASKSSSSVANGKQTDKSGIVLTATPNPFSHTLSVSFKKDKVGKEAYTLSLINSNGNLVASKSVTPNTTLTLNTETYATGTYMLMLLSRDGKVKSMRVVKVNN